eukprot:3377526-Pyramimonas_sp.AAC.1
MATEDADAALMATRAAPDGKVSSVESTDMVKKGAMWMQSQLSFTTDDEQECSEDVDDAESPDRLPLWCAPITAVYYSIDDRQCFARVLRLKRYMFRRRSFLCIHPYGV